MTPPTLDPSVLHAAADGLGITVDAQAIARLCAYLEAMLVENRSVNLTAVRDPAQALMFHALDALAVAAVVDRVPGRVFDLGTGNGFPGVAAAVLWPDCRVVLCDRTRKKLEAIERALHTAEISAGIVWLDVAQVRAQHPERLETFDLVLARAVASPREVARLALPLIARGGELALWLTQEEVLPDSLGDGLRLRAQRDYRLPAPADRDRRIAIWQRR